ncbi:phytoene desaturase family protein [Streptomyces flavofungini]|uniref:phytoene desaturase family protein n=1 Tax=Streptomyces flavofungini TaxID=68200 RepID=UPI0025B15AB7|nr:NAD(P)/FAD-dependent oxidoreductase [Streptomyces flavofungini]WJV51697.1 NAD(P)/FAD-dependent oxidoreductase [Streptomyces flavofungini]
MTDAAIVGSGPNGLAAAVTLARAGLSVAVYEQGESLGGGLRGEHLFDSDIWHDICSAVHPMGAASRFFREFDLRARGVDLLQPEISYGHPMDDGPAALAWRDLDITCERLGVRDGKRWRRLMGPLVRHSRGVVDLLLSDQRSLPRDVRAAMLLAPRILTHATPLARHAFTTEAARALLTGVAGHAVGRLPSLASAAVALMLGHLAHGSGWPIPQGGSVRIAQALINDIQAHGGQLHTSTRIDDLAQLTHARVILLDTGPIELTRLAGKRLPPAYVRRLSRFRYGPGAAKADYLITEPVPWKDPDVGRAGTVHLAGTQAAMWRQETLTARGQASDEPFILLVDPAVTDRQRALPGKRPLWAYAHVPNGDLRDPIPLINARIEQYAPGFTDTIIAARSIPAAAYENYNPNYVGGDISAGALTLTQSLARPTWQVDPYRTPLNGVYLCSASTPPGPSVHGMCGYLAAQSVLRREFGIRKAPSLAPHIHQFTAERKAP